MALSKNNKHKLEQTKQTFKIQDLTKEQAEFILGRKLTDRMWKAYETSEQDDVYSIKRLFTGHKQKSKKPDFSYSDIAKHAAKKRSVYTLDNNSKHVPMKYTGLRNYLKVRKIVTE